jgi:putative DNA primase/helicase
MLTVDRKYREPWTGTLPTRIVILSNELPKFSDSSGALASRFVLLILSESFYDREDPQLTSKLLGEAPAIFNWALVGLDRLLERGHFAQPESARDALRHLEDLSSPVGAFVRDRCEVGPAYEADKDEIYAAWKAWCVLEGADKPGTKEVFTRDLRAAVPGLRPRRPRDGDDRRHTFQGIRLRKQRSGPLTTPDQSRARDGRGQGSGFHATPATKPSDRGGQGWSGVAATVSAASGQSAAVDEDELERLAGLARTYEIENEERP